MYEADDALRVDDDSRRSVHLFGVPRKLPWIDSVAESDCCGSIRQMGLPDSHGIRVMGRIAGEMVSNPMRRLDLLALSHAATVAIVTLEHCYPHVGLTKEFFPFD